jgi:hypothetical membrane protein
MKLSRALVVVGGFLVFALQVHHAQARGPSTPEERAKVIELTRLLERDPLNENAPATRQWLREWIIEVPDIRFKACSDLLGHALGDNYPYSREVNLQTLFSGAAFTIEYPDKAREDIAVYNAGVEGALRVYEVLLKSKPDAKSAFLDDLVAKREHGELVDFVGALATMKCKRANTDWLAALGGAAVGFVLALFIARWFGGRRVHRVAAVKGVTARNGSARVATIAQRIVFVCAAYYLIIGIALHVLEPEYDPRFRFMSEYVWGAYGWLMTTTFFVLGLAALAVAAGLRDIHQSSRSARIGFGLLVVGALFVCLAGVFKEFILHAAAGAVAIPSVVMAALLLSWSFRQASGWQPIYWATLLIALGMLAAFLSSLAQIGMPGLQQRAFLCLFLLWLSIVVHRLVQITRGVPSEFEPTANARRA